MMEKEILVSVILPIYNCQAYLEEAIKSILNQTYTNLEILLIDDGSTDQSYKIAQSFQVDPRVFVLQNDRNRGLIYTLNKGLDNAHGDYVARMDADDICRRNRIEKQVEYLNKHPEIGLVGCYTQEFGAKTGFFAVPNDWRFRARLLFGTVFAHPTFVMRKKLLDMYGIRYRERYIYAEDYDFMIQCAHHFPIGNVESVLLFYRVHEKQVSAINNVCQQDIHFLIQKEILHRYSINIKEQEMPIIRDFLRYKCFTDLDQVEKVNSFICRNTELPDAYQRYLKEVLINICLKSKFRGKGKELIKLGAVQVINTIIKSSINKFFLTCLLQTEKEKIV